MVGSSSFREPAEHQQRHDTGGGAGSGRIRCAGPEEGSGYSETCAHRPGFPRKLCACHLPVDVARSNDPRAKAPLQMVPWTAKPAYRLFRSCSTLGMERGFRGRAEENLDGKRFELPRSKPGFDSASRLQPQASRVRIGLTSGKDL